MTGKIFISYRREESAPSALGIGQYLEKEFGRRNVFIDVDMHAGAKFPLVLEQRLASCKVLLALIGPQWATIKDEDGNRRLDDPTDWVRLEIARALTRGITVIPVRVNGAGLPKKTLLPPDIHGLLDHQATTVSITGFRNEMAGLTRDIRAIPDQRRRAAYKILGSLLCVLLVATLSYLGWLYRETVRSTIFAKNIPATKAPVPGPEWALVGITPDGYASYFRPASVKLQPERVSAVTRISLDPEKPVANDQLIEDAAYQESVVVLSCTGPRVAYAKNTIFNSKAEPVNTFKWGDPEFIDLSIGFDAAPGSIFEGLQQVLCDPKLRQPYVTTSALADLRFLSLQSIVAFGGTADVYWKPLDFHEGKASELLIIKTQKEVSLNVVFPGTKDTLPSHQYYVMRADIDCSKDEVSTPKGEYYNSQNQLVGVIGSGKTPPGPITPTSPIAGIKKIVCSPKEVEKCDDLNLVEGPPLSGIYLGTVQEGEEITNVQLKLVQTGDKIAGSYYRETSCGTVRGTVDAKGDMLFEWAWICL